MVIGDHQRNRWNGGHIKDHANNLNKSQDTNQQLCILATLSFSYIGSFQF